MFSTKDYAKMTLDELVSGEEKVKSQQIPFALFIGLVVGVTIWSASHKEFFLPVILMVFTLMIGSRYSRNLKSIQAEISRRGTIL